MRKLRKKIEAYLLPRLAAFIARLIDLSITYEYNDMHYLEEAKSWCDHGGFAYGLFHNNALLSISSQSFIENGYALTSKSKDGELVAKFAQTFGVKSVRGSSNRGGREALVQLLRVTRKGGRVAFAVDGPKGPRGEVKPGIIYLSQKLQVPILPFSAISDNYWELSKTWDKTRIPKPFSKVTVRYAKPYVVQKDANIEEAQKHLGELLQMLES